MRKVTKSTISLFLCGLLAAGPIGCGGRTVPPKVPVSAETFNPLQDLLHQGYLQLFHEAETAQFSQKQLEQTRSYLEEAQEYCVNRFKQKAEDYQNQVKEVQAELKDGTATIDDHTRHTLHCRIQNLRIEKKEADNLAQHAIPVAYENKKAKLQLLEQWPEDRREILQSIESGAYHDRQYGDVKDIGFRAVGEGQKDDVQIGEETVERMKRQDLLPEEIKNEYIGTYLEDLSKKIAQHSDLRVPVHVTALNSQEINAFALPGGFLFIQRGLLEAVENESQLVGVVAHEIAHAAARHGHELMRDAQIASIIYQVAQVAAIVLTGGASGIGTYYALRYGFMGLGLVLDLKLLGVSKDFELEADRLGTQYAWNSGYDPSGFISFFDKMATKEGYVNGASWFRTHPPFYERMVQTQREIMVLPDKEGLKMNSPEFDRMKEELAKITADAEKEKEDRPSLLAPEKGCPAPETIEHKEGEPIESLCELPREIE